MIAGGNMLSIIVLSYKNRKTMEKFFEKITQQTSKNFELIIVVDTFRGDILNLIEETRKKL